jgi:hypothetical protein
MKIKTILLFLLSTILLFLGFDRNQWGLTSADAFGNFDKYSESLVIGRMVWEREHGFFADGALLGTGDAPSPIIGDPEINYQYDTYLSDGKYEKYAIYKSQSGGQAWIFGLLDSVSPFTSIGNLRVFRAITALLTAATFSALIVWFYLQFGWVTALTVLFTTMISRWPTLYGRNLFYIIWDYFLPMVVALFMLDRESRGKPLKEWKFYLAAGCLLLIKGVLSGYDFLISPMGMVATALVFYAVKDKWVLTRFARRLVLTGLACAAGIISSFVILAFQIGSVTGKFSDGIVHIVNTLGRRTFGTPLDPSASDFFAAGQNAEIFSVIKTVTGKAAIFGSLTFNYLFALFAVVTLLTLLVLWLRRGKLGDTTLVRALLATTWISFLSPLAWLVIFKAHAYYHPFTTPIIWHMPTMFFGYALCGLFFTLLFRRSSAQHS